MRFTSAGGDNVVVFIENRGQPDSRVAFNVQV